MKGRFFMEKFKKILGLEKLSVKKMCLLAMLTAVTVVLAIYCTLRVGNAIKIPLKFISVFITAALYGPVWGGVVGALGDILNSFLVPVGPPLPQITAVEFLYGFIFGLFFYKKYEKKSYFLNTVICAVILTVIDIILMSYILTGVGYFPSFSASVSVRFTASLIKFVLYVIVCVILKKYLKAFERIIGK